MPNSPNSVQKAAKDERLVPERDAADMLGMSIAWMQKARYLGTGPCYVKTGGLRGRAVRYKVSDLVRYIEQNSVETLQGWRDEK